MFNRRYIHNIRHILKNGYVRLNRIYLNWKKVCRQCWYKFNFQRLLLSVHFQSQETQNKVCKEKGIQKRGIFKWTVSKWQYHCVLSWANSGHNQENITSTHFPILHAGETFPFLYERDQGSSSYIWHFFFRLLLSQNCLAHLQENGC